MGLADLENMIADIAFCTNLSARQDMGKGPNAGPVTNIVCFNDCRRMLEKVGHHKTL